MPEPPEQAAPPDDAEDWTHEQWLEWLRATDPDPGTPILRRPGISPDRPLGSRLLGAAMLGMFEAVYGPRQQDEVVIVVESGEDTEPEPMEVHLVPEHPEESSVVLRPWLREDPQQERPARGPDLDEE
ncbi:MAG: hypothetical protein ACYDAD_13405 [Acidimicrobiales bacterium]